MAVYIDVIYLCFGFVSIIIALFDFLFYRIPNVLVALNIILFLILASLGLIGENGGFNLQGALLVGALTFVIGLLCYFFKWMGAGDVKFIAVSSLFSSYVGMNFVFLFITSLVGGFIAGICYFSPGYMDGIRIKLIEVLKKTFQNNSFFMGYANQPFLFVENENRRKVRIPYGVAIMSGSAFVIYNVLTGQGIR